ncbi:hypothetical protein, partial [Ottowia pentelensis]
MLRIDEPAMPRCKTARRGATPLQQPNIGTSIAAFGKHESCPTRYEPERVAEIPTRYEPEWAIWV